MIVFKSRVLVLFKILVIFLLTAIDLSYEKTIKDIKLKKYSELTKAFETNYKNDIIKQCLEELENFDSLTFKDLKSTTELCLSKLRVKRSLQKNSSKNKKENDKNDKQTKEYRKKKKKKTKKNKNKNKGEKHKKEKNKKEKKKKKKKEKNDKRNDKKTTKGKKNKNIKNKPKSKNISKKCEVKKSKSAKKVRSKRQAKLEKGLPYKEFIKQNKPAYPEFEAVLKEINNCLSTAFPGNNRKRKLDGNEINMAMEKCPKLQKILEKDYSYNDVTIILILDNNELYIDKKYYHPDIKRDSIFDRTNAKRRLIFKCGLETPIYKYYTPIPKVRIPKKKTDILDNWYSNHCYQLPSTSSGSSDIKISDKELSELIEQTSLTKMTIKAYLEIRDKDTTMEIDTTNTNMKMKTQQKDILDHWYYTKICLSGKKISDDQASLLAEQTSLPTKTIKKYMIARKEGTLFEDDRNECGFTSQSLIELLRHQIEEHSNDKPQEESDTGAPDAKIPRPNEPTDEPVDEPVDETVDEPADEPVDDDNDINLTQDQVQRLTDLYNYPPDPDSMSPFWINNGCWDTNITDLANKLNLTEEFIKNWLIRKFREDNEK